MTDIKENPRPASDYMAARDEDWSEYRAEAIAEGEKFLERVEGILDTVRKNAHYSEENGKVSDETVQAIIDAGFFRSFTPKRYGGLEMAPAAFYEGVMRIAECDSSAAWITGQLNIHSFEVALMSEKMQDEFWGNDPNTRASSSYAPVGKWEETEGGYILNGTWPFSSGVDHADWVFIGGRDRNFVVPVSDVSIDQGSWDVQGLKGTGSKAVTLDNVFVPTYRTHHMINNYEDKNLGWDVNNRPLYWLSWMAMFNSTPVNTAIGTAVDAINVFVEQSKVRLNQMGTGAPAAKNPFLHLKLANAISRVETVKLRQLDSWRRFFDMACEGKDMPYLDRMRLRFETADAIATSYEAIADIWPIAGAASSATSNPMQQRMRDLMAARNHGTAGKELAAQQWAGAIFDLPKPEFKDFGTLTFHK